MHRCTDLSLDDGTKVGKYAFRTKPGHETKWEKIAKMYVSNFGKAVPDGHWATHEKMYGHNSGGVSVSSSTSRWAMFDAGFANAKKFMDQMGESV